MATMVEVITEPSQSIDPMALGRVIYWWRKKLGLSQKELAKRIGAPRTYIAKIEHGKFLPKPQRFSDIAIALGLKPEELAWYVFDRERFPTYPFPEDAFFDELQEYRHALSPRRQKFLEKSLQLFEEECRPISGLDHLLRSFRQL